MGSATQADHDVAACLDCRRTRPLAIVTLTVGVIVATFATWAVATLVIAGAFG